MRPIPLAGVLPAGLLALLVCSSSAADSITPSHRCTKPSPLSAFASDAEKSARHQKLAAYRQCLNDFIRDQERAARTHSDAARSAAGELSRAVN